jgi:uncharacterized damage-inducible protein DinB
MLDHLRRMFVYDRWANHEMLRSLETEAGPRSLKLFAHVIAAEALWFDRLESRSSGAVWPELTLAECRSELAHISERSEAYLSELSPESLTTPISYTNSKGEPWVSSVGDILTHVVLHASYHRGQIASDVRAAGKTPPYTDYIHCVRQGLID